MESKSLVSRFKFPQELLDKIIGEIGSDQPTLRSCAVVCHAFLPACQIGLFSEIHLIQKGDNAQRLHDVLVNAPHLRNCVRTLILTLTDVRTLILSFTGDGHEDHYSSILGLLPAVSSFSLTIEDDTMENITIQDEDQNDPRTWNNLPMQLRAAVCNLCRRSDLVSLQLSNLEAFTDLAEFDQLVASPALAELTLHMISLPDPKADGTSLRKHLGLNKLVFYLDGHTQRIITHWLVEGKSLSNLRRLCVAWARETVSRLQELLNALSSLEDLTLESPNGKYFLTSRGVRPPYVLSVYDSDDHWNTLSFATLKRLRILELTIAVDDTTCGGLAHLFSRLLEPCSRTLERFGFTVLLCAEPPTIEWQPLSDILNTVTFPALARVDFWASAIREDYLPLAFQSDHPADKFHIDFQNGFHHLAEQGILNMVITAPERSVYPLTPWAR
ncbi:hypothetical protein DFH06DRAFT_1370490 [Mycena polygramma]|nr:hypothetical protein DFH06DRAFT_1370490 [Mycena polygramma]